MKCFSWWDCSSDGSLKWSPQVLQTKDTSGLGSCDLLSPCLDRFTDIILISQSSFASIWWETGLASLCSGWSFFLCRVKFADFLNVLSQILHANLPFFRPFVWIPSWHSWLQWQMFQFSEKCHFHLILSLEMICILWLQLRLKFRQHSACTASHESLHCPFVTTFCHILNTQMVWHPRVSNNVWIFYIFNFFS